MQTPQRTARSLLMSTSALTLLGAMSGQAFADEQAQEGQRRRQQVEEIVVTATKRAQSSQDIAVAIDALGETELEELNIDNFEDYLVQLPGVTAGGSGPGQSTIYIRGLASTTPNLTTAGVAGLAPNVALYLDEQPVSQPGRNLDVYAVDLERIEVLPGPQGTLFGASSQAGTVRLITNKPDPSQFEAKANFGAAFTQKGEMSNKAEGIINVPILPNLAVRGVAYVDSQGGYIDNVFGTRDLSESARFRPEGTVRANGVPVSGIREGFQAGADLSDVTFLETDNAELVEDNFNDTTYAGFRFATLWDITPDWTVTVSHARQNLNSEGVFFSDPNLGDLQIERFADDEIDDDFHNTSWTLEGRFAGIEAVYTGAFTDRDTDQSVDYTDYLFVGQYLPYYICDGSVTYPGDDTAPSGVCQPPNLVVNSTTNTQVITQELRFNTPERFFVRGTFGGFYSDLEIEERNDFNYEGSIAAEPFGPFAPNFPFMTGFTSDPGPFPPGVIFRNDIRRTDQQFGVFGEVTVDVIPQLLSVTGGLRYYDVEVDFEGSANSSFFNSGAAEDQQAFGTDISDLYNGDGQFTFRGTGLPQQTFTLDDSLEDIMAAGLSEAAAQQVFNAVRAPDVAETNGVIFKANVSVTPTPDTLVYFTFSEGFRPGLLNRPGGAQGPGGFTVPFELETDEVKNYELGWKLDLLNNTLRVNGNAFFVDVENLQTTIFDPSITNLFFSANAANARILGVEGDFNWATPLDGLFINGAFSILDTEITDVLVPTDDVIEGEELAFSPTFQGNLRARYEFPVLDDYLAHVQSQISYSGSSRSDIIEINAIDLDSYVLFGMAAGLRKERWSVELYADNLSNSRAEISNNFVFDRERVTIIRPRTVGIRVGLTY